MTSSRGMDGRTELRVLHPSRIKPRSEAEPAWLIEGLWGSCAVGLIGGAPKSCKSWLALEMAVAVASGRPCLGRYAVPTPGGVLIFAAEDTPLQVRERLEGLCRARGADFSAFNVGLIVEPSLRIDRADDLARLGITLASHRPKLLVLDPYIRLQRVDENNSTEVSAILGALRGLSREFELAMVLVHHARKNAAEYAGQALRGSGDFHAWADSALYLKRQGEDLVLSVEHRAAASPPPSGLSLVRDDGPVRLELRELPSPLSRAPLAERILQLLEERGPLWQEDLRKTLRVRNQVLTDVCKELAAFRRVRRTAKGWATTNGLQS